MNFNFGAPKPSGGLTSTATSTAATPTLNFGSGDNKGLNTQTPVKPSPAGLAFGTPTTTNTTGFTLGSAGSATPNLTFGNPAAPVSNFSLGAAPTTTQTAKATTAGGFMLGASTTTATIPTLGLGTTTTAGLTLGAPASSVPATGFTLGTAPASTATGLSFGSLSSTGLNLGSTTTTTATTGFTLGKLGSTSAATPLLGTTTTTLTTSLGTTTTSTPTALGSLNFNQIEEVLNKWTLELEEQGKVFINQALQLNAWDRLVIANGEKILTLNNGIEKIKQQQQQLDHELEFVLIQQRELEECIAPLEKELKDIPIADHDRNHTYQMAENMDTQLKQMSEDLKEIIEHLNESNKSEDCNDPVSQIGRILNAHMNSLQWIDRNTAQISTLLDQITKMHDMHRRDNERSFHLTYE